MGMAPAAAAVFHGEGAFIYLADLQQAVLVPLQGPSGHNHDESSRMIGGVSTVADRACQQMQQLIHAANARDDENLTRIRLPLVDGNQRLGVLAVTLPIPALNDEPRMRRLQGFTSVVASWW
jgi:hypothetical protein